MPQIRQTACNRDCPDACALEVHLDDKGRALAVRGRKQDPITRGFVCERTSRFVDRQYSSDRLETPLIRDGKDQPLRPVSWEEAMERCAHQLLSAREAFGAQSILHYHSGGSLGLLKKISDHLFGLFGPVTTKHGDICCGAGIAAQVADFGVAESHDIFDLYHSKTVVVWGKNVHTSSVHLLPILLEAKRKGARLIGLDVVKTRLASICDDFIQLRPAGDAALALGVAAWALERGLHQEALRERSHGYEEFLELLTARSWPQWADLAGAAPEALELLGRAYTEPPCATHIGWGLARRSHGGAAVRAIDALAAFTGNLGIAGGGASYYFGRRTAYDTSFMEPAAPPRTLSESLLGAEILAADPPVRAIWITAGNPVAMLPDAAQVEKALRSTDFVVVVDTHLTDTAQLADVVLPTLTLLEDDDLLGAYGNHYLRASTPAVTPVGQARHELEIWSDLAQRLGLGDALAGTPREWKQRMLSKLRPFDISLEDLQAGGVRNPLASQVLFEGLQFATPDGKMNLVTEFSAPPPACSEFPFTLMAVSTSKSQSSQWSLPPTPLAVVRCFPGVFPAGPARLCTAKGQMKVQVVPDDTIHPNVLWMEKGRAPSHGGCPNQLIEAVETDIGGGAAFYDQPARLEPLA